MPERIETDAAEFGSRVVTEVARDKAVGGLMKRDGDDERQYPNRHIVNGDVQSIFLIGSTKSTTLSWIDRAIGPQRRAGITGEPSPDTAAGRLRASPNSFFPLTRMCSVGANALRSSNTASTTPAAVTFFRQENR